jgi:hypothetical protein
VSAKSREFVIAALTGGIIAGTIDIGAACLISGRSVPHVLDAIAGGLLAEEAFAGGARTAFLGGILQELMGILIAAVFAGAAQVLPPLRRRWIMAGVAYGVVIFFVMNYVVVPLSAWHAVPHFTAGKLVGNLLAMLFFGVIVAYFASRQSLPFPMTAQAARLE